MNEYLAETVVAVFGIHDASNSLDEDLLRPLTEYLAASVAECGTYQLIPPWEIQRLSRLEKIVSGREYFEPEFQIALAAQLKAGMSVSTTITRDADTCTVVSALDDVRQQTQLISARAQGDCSEAGLVKSIEDVAYFFILWGGCKPPLEGVPEVTEDLYRQAAAADVLRPPLIRERRLPEVEEINGEDVVAVPDVLVSVGWNMQNRELSRPRHQSGLGHGIRLDVRLFLAAFLDVPGLRDLGVAGMYSASSMFDFVIEHYGDRQGGSISNMQVELLYRVALKHLATRPAFLFRLGYGYISSTIEGGGPVSKDAGYDYPYLALEAAFMPYQPYVRLWASGALLFGVEPSKDLEGGPYLGFKAGFGLDYIPVEFLHFGLGYEVVRFSEVMVGSDVGPDTYMAFFLRAGCSIH
ncbi:hypothetical protein ACFL2F_01040 [Myxococcota bacterium]